MKRGSPAPAPAVIGRAAALRSRSIVGRGRMRALRSRLVASGRDVPAQREWPYLLLLAAAVVATVVVLDRSSHGLGFFFDEWIWIFGRRALTVDNLLRNHNGHLNLFPVLAYWILFHTAGLRTYVPYLSLLLVLHVATCVMLFCWLRRRVAISIATAASIVLLFLGYAWQDLLWAFQIQYVGAVAAGLGALLLVERNTRRADVGACACIFVAIATSGVGIPFALGILAFLAWRRETWRRIWIVVVPFALYGAWFLGYGSAGSRVGNLARLPGYLWGASAAASGAIAGASIDYGYYIIGASAAIFAARLVFRRVEPLTAAVVVMPLAYWSLTAITRADVVPPATSRYLYVGAVFLFLVLGDLLHEQRIHALVVLVVAAIVAWSIQGNVNQLGTGSEFLRGSWTSIRTDLGALSVLRSRIHSDAVLDPLLVPTGRVEDFVAAMKALGNVASSASQIRHAPEFARAAADSSLFRAVTEQVPVSERPSPGPDPIAELIRGESDVVLNGPCATFQRAKPPAFLSVRGDELDLSFTGSASKEPVMILIKSLATTQYGIASLRVRRGRVALTHLPRWPIAPWVLLVSSASPVTVCRLPQSSMPR